MDLDGIDAAFLYPSVGLFAGAVHDPDLSAALSFITLASRQALSFGALRCQPA
jgi:hypothetical protein